MVGKQKRGYMEQQDALDTQQQFADDQASGLGATDTPKILGLSKYGTALTVWESKVNPGQRDKSSLPAWLGMQLQSTVAELYTSATGWRVRAATKQYRHPVHEFILCHLDYKVWGDPMTLVECKTRAYMKGWGADGSTDIPPDVWAQVQHEMWVTGAERCHVAVLFGHHTFRVYPIPYDETFITTLRTTLTNFWHFNVEPRIPPDAGANDGPNLSKAYPKDDGDVLTATAEQSALVRELAVAEGKLAKAEAEVARAENVIKQALGKHEGFFSTAGTVLWKTTKERHYTNWEVAFYTLIDDYFSGNKPDQDEVKRLVAEHTTIKPGIRRFGFSEYQGGQDA